MNQQSSTTTEVISKKAIIVGLVLVVVNAYWVGIASELWYAVYTLVSPFSNAVFTLVVLIVLNVALKKFSPRIAFTPAELLLIYIMVTMVSTISGHAMMAILMGTLAHPFWFATPENEWAQLFLHHIPEWLTVHESEWLAGYYEGESSIYFQEHLRIWVKPILVWSSFIFLLYGSLLCLGLLLRKQWMEREKLSFPLTQLPLQMVTNRKFFLSRALWIGFGIAALLRVMGGLHDLFPVIPTFPTSFRLDRYITERPWNAVGYVSMSFNLAIVGLTYFMPLDLAFSTWFFFWLTRAERVIASSLGLTNIGKLYLNERASGAWVGIAVLTIWMGRRHFIRIFKHLVGIEHEDDVNEPFSYRTTAILTVLSIVGVFGFCYLAGMSLWVIAVFYILFVAFAVAIGRVRAELGPPYHEVIGINPRGMMVNMFGTRNLGATNLTIMTFLYAFNRCNRSHPMPNQVESLRIGDRGGIPGKTLVYCMALAIGIGAVATFWTYLQVGYQYGVLARCEGHVGHFGWESFNPLQSWLQYPKEVNYPAITFMSGGFLFVFLLHFLRTHLMWWTLHPSGYVLSGASWGGLIYFWFPVMVSWLIKFMILKFSGWQAYRRAIPFFLGLVLGDFVPRSVLSLISFVMNLYMPSSGAGHSL
ncbi:hypothetical protein C6497_13860 [Candidatus Poribacteria bacterium]|nr:MAG: hypothetical protein C6497_13860 [Candidatus Poribacteria bacterium]